MDNNKKICPLKALNGAPASEQDLFCEEERCKLYMEEYKQCAVVVAVKASKKLSELRHMNGGNS